MVRYRYNPRSCCDFCLDAHGLNHRQMRKLGKREVGGQASQGSRLSSSWIKSHPARAWFWYKESPAGLSALRCECCATHSAISSLLFLPLCPVIVHLFCFYSPSDQRPSKTGPTPWAPSWLRQLFDHDEQWAGVQQLHWLRWRWQHKQVGRTS